MISLGLFAAITGLHAQGFIEVPVKLDIEKGHLDNGVIVKVQKDGKDAFTQSGSSKIRFKFNYNMKYTLIFTKEGYITKTIEFDTHVPAERIKAGFDPYTIGVKLFPQESEDHKVVYNQAVGLIRYDKDLDEFNYETDYSKSILSNMKDENTAEKITKDTAINKPVIAPAEPEKLAMKEKKEVLKGKPDNNENAIAEPQQTTMKESTEKLRGAKDDNTKNMLAMTGGGDDGTDINNNNGGGANDVNKPELPNNGNDINKVHQPVKGNDVNKVMVANQGNDVNKVRLTDQGNDVNKVRLTNQGNDLSKPHGRDGGSEVASTVRSVNAGAESSEKKLYATGKSESQSIQQYDESENITREDIVEDKRVITIIKVTKKNVTTEYRRVTYRWGGLYYFQDNKLSISENVFAFYTGVKE